VRVGPGAEVTVGVGGSFGVGVTLCIGVGVITGARLVLAKVTADQRKMSQAARAITMVIPTAFRTVLDALAGGD